MTDVAEELDWSPLIRLALGRLGWTPDVFWNATPAELRLALEGRFGRVDDGASKVIPVRRQELLDLMQRFPDARL